MNKKFASLGTALSRDEAKKVVGGDGTLPIFEGGDGVSCLCKNGKSAGMSSCTTCDKWCKNEHSSSEDTCS